MIEAKEPSFFKYIDSNGKMKSNAPESAKKAFKSWKENPMKVKPKKKVKR